jgi:putative hydrolase of the HAD superfamily
VTRDAVHARIVAVSFDAGGTLVEAVEPVGETYARLARAAGFPVTAAALEAGFQRAFAAAPPLAPPPHATQNLTDFERAWWRAVVDASLDHALAGAAGDDPAARERFFAATFEHYANTAAWRLLPEVTQVLAELQRRGPALLVISNFDRRLHALLAGLGIADLFRTILPSSEAGAAKPARAIFEQARRRLGGVRPEQIVHVGDSLREDVQGALAAGWQAVWLARDAGSTAAPAGATRIATLGELPGVLQSAG